MGSEVAIGVDIGGSHIKSAGVDLTTGEIIQSSIAEKKMDNKADASVVFEDWSSAINQSISALGNRPISGIGFAMPGPFNYQEGTAWFEGNDKYESLYGLKIEDHLLPLLLTGSQTSLRYHNDASCFAIGEDGYGVSKDENRSISITLGTGFGSAFIDSGVPVVNRMDVPKDGCLWHLPFKEGIADDYFSTRWFIKEYAAISGEKLAGVKEIATLYPHNSKVRGLFDDFGHMLGSYLSLWIKTFQADMVVIGGNISQAFDLFATSLCTTISQSGVACEFKTSVLKEDAAIIGSARLLDDSYFALLKDHLPTK